MSWIREAPKIDLHVHLDGSLRPETVVELAERLPPDRRFAESVDLRRAVIPARRCSLEDYLEAFRYTVAVLQTEDALERAAYELCSDAARENVVYIEIRFAPLLHLEDGLTPREAVEAVLSGMRRAQREFGHPSGLILTALKHESTERSIEVAQLAAQFNGKGVVAVDLAGPERNYPPRLHRAAIDFAHDAGIHLTVHAGEGCCPEQIKEAVDLGADRIGHGVYLFQDPDTEKRIAELGIPLEVCPTSNLQISGFIRTYGDHPLKRYDDIGIPITLNTDNRLMARTTLSDEFEHVVDAFGFDRSDVRRIVENSVRAAFASEAVKDALRETVTDAFSG
jgi:adenosine deaminase